MKKLTPFLAFSLCCAWAMVVVGLPLGFDLFKNFKIEMPAITILSFNLLHFPFLLVCTAGIALSGLLLAQRKPLGWNLSLAVCLLCDFLLVSFALPFFQLAKFVGTSAILNNIGVLLLVASVVLVQTLLVTLLVTRHDWVKPRLAI